MKRIMMVGLCLVSVLVMSAVAVATASATVETPQFRFATGSKEFSSSGGVGKLETEKEETVTCQKETDSGEIEGASPSHRIRDILISYKECRSSILNAKCKSAGANEEEIKPFDLLARLGWISKPEEKVGILFNPETGRSNNPNNLFAEFSCGGTPIKVKGSVIALIPTSFNNKLIDPGEHYTLEFKKGSTAGHPGDPKFEGLPVNEIRTETAFTGGLFIESSTEGSVNIFPLVSTTLEA